MSEVLSESLLEQGSARRSRVWKYGTTAAVAALVLSAGYVGYSVGQSNAHEDVDSDAITAKLVYSGNSSQMSVVSYTSACYGYTGGTCLANDCNKDRHSKCMDGKCLCEGGCSGADGVCYGHANVKVAEKFSLTNSYWNSHWLYIQKFAALGQLKVSSSPGWTFGGGEYFDLYQLAGTVKGNKQYFLASNTWKNWVASIRATGSVLSGSVSLYGLYALNLVHTIAPWDIEGLVVQVCSLEKNGEPNGIMIGSPGKARTEWAYVHRGSWLVYAWDLSGDPGTGGHWTTREASGRLLKIPGLDPC